DHNQDPPEPPVREDRRRPSGRPDQAGRRLRLTTRGVAFLADARRTCVSHQRFARRRGSNAGSAAARATRRARVSGAAPREKTATARRAGNVALNFADARRRTRPRLNGTTCRFSLAHITTCATELSPVVLRVRRYSMTASPEPPNSFGKSFSFGSPS